jgi:DUF4097 and DUF4098 domain-containing protein YvlB
MNEERKRILNMLASGKITADEAENLLDALGRTPGDENVSDESSQSTDTSKKMPQYLRVKVESTKGDNINIRIPFRILRAGIRLTSLMPPSVAKNVSKHLSEKGIDLDFTSLKNQNLESLIEALSEMEVNVDSANGDKIRVFCE